MKRKILLISVIWMMLLGNVISYGVISGNVPNPEITDDENDVVIVYPNLIDILYSMNFLNQKSPDFLDITSAWFYENSMEPDLLYASIKVKDITFHDVRVIYSIWWDHNGIEMSACVHVLNKGDISLFSATNDYLKTQYGISGSFDLDSNIITFKIPKNMIGDPEPGDELINPCAWAGFRFSRESLLTTLIGELAKDFAEGTKNYVILY